MHGGIWADLPYRSDHWQRWNNGYRITESPNKSHTEEIEDIPPSRMVKRICECICVGCFFEIAVEQLYTVINLIKSQSINSQHLWPI